MGRAVPRVQEQARAAEKTGPAAPATVSAPPGAGVEADEPTPRGAPGGSSGRHRTELTQWLADTRRPSNEMGAGVLHRALGTS